MRGYADIRWVLIALAAGIVVLVLARAAYLTAVQARVRRSSRSRRGAGKVDPWTAAASEAAQARYAEAAHLLYAAVLEAIARHHRIVLHPARTSGEYERDLRRRGSGAAHDFSAFTRAYERAVWRGHGIDAGTYDILRQRALTLVESRQRLEAA